MRLCCLPHRPARAASFSLTPSAFQRAEFALAEALHRPVSHPIEPPLIELRKGQAPAPLARPVFSLKLRATLD